MGKKKLQRYAEVPELENVTDMGDLPPQRKEWTCGNWNSGIFNRQAPLILELACGKGDYTLGLAQHSPECNYVGIDMKGDRIWKAATLAMQKKLHNVHFIRGRIDHITEFFDRDEVDQIWITFPDPFPRKSKAKRRLTHSVFLQRYQHICKPGSKIHLKTDDEQFLEFTLDQLEQLNMPVEEVIRDVYVENPVSDELLIKTYYETLHLSEGKCIKYIRFRVD